MTSGPGWGLRPVAATPEDPSCLGVLGLSTGTVQGRLKPVAELQALGRSGEAT